MTGRGRGRLFKEAKDLQNNAQANFSSSSTTDIKSLFNVPRSPHEVYRILKANLLDVPYSENKLRSCLDAIVSNMIQDSTNNIEICKYMYVCSCSTDRKIGVEIWSNFYKILEVKYKEIDGKGDQTNEDMRHNFTKFFIVAVHFMRNPKDPPRNDIISAVLILIERLKKTVNDDRNLYCQAMAWISSYKGIVASWTVLTQAFCEAVNQMREWIVEGVGGHWAMACLEATCNEGLLPSHSRVFYNKTLPRSQFSNLTENCSNILIPAVDKSKYNLPNINCIHYID